HRGRSSTRARARSSCSCSSPRRRTWPGRRPSSWADSTPGPSWRRAWASVRSRPRSSEPRCSRWSAVWADAPFSAMQTYNQERRSKEHRYVALLAIAVAGFAVIAVGLLKLQIQDHDYYLRLAQENRIRLEVMRAPRG